jgi:hypothetical protein
MNEADRDGQGRHAIDVERRRRPAADEQAQDSDEEDRTSSSAATDEFQSVGRSTDSTGLTLCSKSDSLMECRR